MIEVTNDDQARASTMVSQDIICVPLRLYLSRTLGLVKK